MEFQLERTIEILRCTPGTLRSLLDGLSEPWVRCTEGAESWSPYDIVGHLVQGEKTDWIPRLRAILEHGESQPFEPFDRFAQFETSRGKTIEELLDEFATLRAENLETLRAQNLRPLQLELKGTHPGLGAVSVRELLATWATHDLAHIAQITRVMARNYSNEVGPWQAYLPILED